MLGPAAITLPALAKAMVETQEDELAASGVHRAAPEPRDLHEDPSPKRRKTPRARASTSTAGAAGASSAVTGTPGAVGTTGAVTGTPGAVGTSGAVTGTLGAVGTTGTGAPWGASNPKRAESEYVGRTRVGLG